MWKNVPEIDAFDLLMSVAIPKNTLDDHYFLFPGYLWRGLELIGHEYLQILMRPAVRYAARPSAGERRNRPPAPIDNASPAPSSDNPSDSAFASSSGISG